jgi:hypothetical protein
MTCRGKDRKRARSIFKSNGTPPEEGIATKIDASSVELEGKFISHWVRGYVGIGLKMSLTGSLSALSGSPITERGNIPTTVELTKAK